MCNKEQKLFINKDLKFKGRQNNEKISLRKKKIFFNDKTKT